MASEIRPRSSEMFVNKHEILANARVKSNVKFRKYLRYIEYLQNLMKVKFKKNVH